jgi:hypothetical protein
MSSQNGSKTLTNNYFSKPEIGPLVGKKITADEMWSLTKTGDQTWGIEGYEVPREYHDYKQSKWHKERWEMIKKPKGQWPPSNWKVNEETGKAIPPKRPNYLDQVYKWAHSFYNPERAEEVKQALEDKGHPLDKPPEKPKKDNTRGKFLQNEEAKKKWKAERNEIPEWKADAVEAIKEKVKEDNKKKKNNVQKMREKYGVNKKSLPLCDRITIVSEAEYLGEKYPFYNTYVNPDDEPVEEVDDDGNKKKTKRKPLFYPNVFLSLHLEKSCFTIQTEMDLQKTRWKIK